MTNKHNLFTYATKELSQDAFLLWLFNNFDSMNERVRKAAYILLNEFTGLNMEIGSITTLRTESQVTAKGKEKESGKMDIVVYFTFNDTDYLIAIEDKTGSGEHDQLGKYSDTLVTLGVGEKNIFKIFYKTDIKDPYDFAACKKHEWTTYFIDNIYPLFKEFYDSKGNVTATGSEILDDYIEHIRDLYIHCTQLPSEINMKAWNKDDYRIFFYLKILKDIEEYDKRLSFKNVYETHDYYAKFVCACRYFLPGSEYCLTIRFDFNKNEIKGHIGVSNCKMKEVPFKVEEERLPQKIEKTVTDAVLYSFPAFTPKKDLQIIIERKKANTNKGGEGKYLVFLDSNEIMDKIINYNESPDKVAKEIKELFKTFYDECEKINI